MSMNNFELEEATSGLRFNNGKLEQCFKVVNYVNGEPESGYMKWKPVPEITDKPKDDQ